MRQIRLQKGKQFLFSLDAEVDGLYGKPFAIGAVVYDIDGDKVDEFVLKRDVPITNAWVKENVLPQLEGIETITSYYYLLKRFTDFYKKYKDVAMFIVHMGYPVEAFLFREMHNYELIEDFDGPFPLFDIASDLRIAHEDPLSPDIYVETHGLDIDFEGGTHNPLYDSIVAAKVYMDLNFILL
jgi:hypothetical protein